MIKDEDIILVNKVKESNCQESLKQLIEKHTPLCNSIYNRYSSSLISSGVFMQDVYNDKDYMVYKAILSYKENKKTKFSTWLGNHARYQCLNAINGRRKYLCLPDEQLNFFYEERGKENDSPTNALHEEIFELLASMKDERVKRVFDLRYDNSGKSTWADIGKKMSVSTQTAINLHNKGKIFIRKKMLKKG